MRRLITPQAMRQGEADYFASSGVSSIEVMERAAKALADAISADLPAGSTVYFACGTGGNGGDGTACARLLRARYRCVIFQPRPPKSPDAVENLRRARVCGIPVAENSDWFLPEEEALPLAAPQRHPDDLLPRPDAWVDALFGTGLSRAPGGAEAELIARINLHRAQGTRVYAADIPSGLNGETGEAYAPCVRADRTVTFQHIKLGMVDADGFDYCGALTVADVGFPEETFGEASVRLFEPADIGRTLPKRRRNLHKGQCGHLLIVAGSTGMAGAAAMCARAALRSGAGLVSIACPEGIVNILQSLAPQAMCVPLAEEGGAICAGALPALEDALKGKSAVAIGPGLTRRAAVCVLEAVLRSGLPAAIDADALNLLSEHRELLPLLCPHHVLTPHPGEAARLAAALPATSDDPPAGKNRTLASARRLAGLGATALCKGTTSMVCTPRQPFALVSASGCCGMARGGSGDILTGILGALLADRICPSDPALAAACASEIHGLAGELAQEKYGSRAMNAADILEFLPEVFKRYAD